MEKVLKAKAKRTAKTISKMKTSDFKSYSEKRNPKINKMMEQKKGHKVKKAAVLGLKKIAKGK